MKKQRVSILLFILIAIPWLLLHANDLFEELVQRFSQPMVKEFVGLVKNGNRYPLMRTIRDTRYQVMREYLDIQRPIDTLPCTHRRILGTEVPENFSEFCQRYDQIVDTAKLGVSSRALFEKYYLAVEPMLIIEIEQQQARNEMKVWIDRKIRCLNDKFSCGREERRMLERVTARDKNLLNVYQFHLVNLRKKLFPDDASDLKFVDQDLVQSPCRETANLPGGLVSNEGMILIPKGVFVQGSNDGRPDEKPAHAVELNSYWIDRCEVTNDNYLQYLAKDPYLRKSTFPRKFHDGDYLKHWLGDLQPPNNVANLPVTHVSWFAARYYCRKQNKRLPSEAEWEKAARAGTFTPYYHGENVAQLPQYAWYNANSEGTIRLVTDRLPNDWKIYDMLGNAWEWVYDWYAPYPKQRQVNPQGPADGKYRVLRGGSFTSPVEFLRVSMRGDDSPLNTNPDVGFRCAADADRSLLPQSQ